MHRFDLLEKKPKEKYRGWGANIPLYLLLPLHKLLREFSKTANFTSGLEMDSFYLAFIKEKSATLTFDPLQNENST